MFVFPPLFFVSLPLGAAVFEPVFDTAELASTGFSSLANIIHEGGNVRTPRTAHRRERFLRFGFHNLIPGLLFLPFVFASAGVFRRGPGIYRRAFAAGRVPVLLMRRRCYSPSPRLSPRRFPTNITFHPHSSARGEREQEQRDRGLYQRGVEHPVSARRQTRRFPSFSSFPREKIQPVPRFGIYIHRDPFIFRHRSPSSQPPSFTLHFLAPRLLRCSPSCGWERRGNR